MSKIFLVLGQNPPLPKEKKIFPLGVFSVPQFETYVPSPRTYISGFGTYIPSRGTQNPPRGKNICMGIVSYFSAYRTAHSQSGNGKAVR